ncbi:Cadmium-transporting ATPase [Herminiimonas arsenicoxydans]|uniref:P-type Zn(2+) transporter n=1 Tax=Herminiimonas arsenicoxydans TaxID=204773 RepID=A4G5G6_HERAR|nr:Cadmium-transporting ATPase [Herminiimonas arsenicoxydans]
MAEIQRPQNKQSISDCCEGSNCRTSSNAAIQPFPAPLDAPSNAQSVQYRISNMDCPTEEKLIRNKLEGMNGIIRLDFNLMNRILSVHHQLKSLESVTTALKAIGMDAQLVDSEAHQPKVPESASLTAAQKILLAISGVAALAAEVLAWTTHTDGSPLVIALAFISIATGGLPTLKKGWIALKTFTLNINFLMSLAVIGAMAIGQWPEAAMVVFLFAVAELIESLSLNRARNAVHGLLKLAPDVVTLQDAIGGWQEKSVETAVVGDMMRVKPGERIALDGIVTSGESSVNQAPITGESMPVDKRIGDAVYAGSINERGLLDIKVSTNSSNSTLARIVRVIEETQNNKAATQRFVDTFARYYTPAVVVMAILVAVIPPLVFGAEFTPWLYKALVMLVIACPCALVISTPVTVVSGLTAAARLGILIKGGEFLEVGYKLKAIALDKTGTLTAGQPSVVDVKTISNNERETILLLAASLDANSDHPLANAIVKAGPESSLHKVVTNFEALPGRGVKGEIDGTIYFLGNHRLIEELKVCNPAIEALLDVIEGTAQTAVMLATEKTVVGIIAIADSLRESAIESVRQLNQLGITTVMLTGDNNRTAQQIGAHVGISVIKAELLPEDKLTEIKNLQSTYGVVGMLGDGINDAPALAQADVGFAMGAAGSDTAIETADVALMNDDLEKLPVFIKLSRATRSILIQNISAAIGIKAIFFVLAFMGIATLWMAVFADVGASLLVVFNGLRLLRK